jgi:hypothetical protein
MRRIPSQDFEIGVFRRFVLGARGEITGTLQRVRQIRVVCTVQGFRFPGRIKDGSSRSTAGRPRRCSRGEDQLRRTLVKRLFKLMIPLAFAAIAGCVVAPVGRPYRPYGYGYVYPRVGVVVPAPVVVVRP